MSAEDLPDPTRIEGAPHPRDTAHLYGQSKAEAAFLDAFATGRLHHGWMLSGPRGIGKATLAWRIARFLLAQPAADRGEDQRAGNDAKVGRDRKPGEAGADKGRDQVREEERHQRHQAHQEQDRPFVFP